MSRINLGTDTSGRPLVVDSTTRDKLRYAEWLLGFTFTIVQGSWRGGSGARASAGTHDGGGVVDLRTWNLPSHISPQDAVRALRLAGLIAWYRTKAQGFDPHIHAIDFGNPSLAPSAARQVTSWQQGRNGLASNGPDDGPRVDVPRVAPKIPNPVQKAMATVVVANVAKQARIHLGLAKGKVTARGGVKVLQRNLNRRYGTKLLVDGIWGPATDRAWRAHERNVGISGRAGVPDRKTVLALAGALFKIK